MVAGAGFAFLLVCLRRENSNSLLVWKGPGGGINDVGWCGSLPGELAFKRGWGWEQNAGVCQEGRVGQRWAPGAGGGRPSARS